MSPKGADSCSSLHHTITIIQCMCCRKIDQCFKSHACPVVVSYNKVFVSIKKLFDMFNGKIRSPIAFLIGVSLMPWMHRCQVTTLVLSPTGSFELGHMSRFMRKPAFCICENKDADQLISAFVFAAWIVQSLYFLNPKFQASSHLL